MSLLSFLKKWCQEAPSVKALKRAIDTKHCTVNGQIETFSSYRVQFDDDIVLDVKTWESKKIEATIPVLHEDESLLVCNKPSGITCDPRSLIPLLPHSTPLFLVHRLDKETSGALLLAKTPQVKEQLLLAFKKRQVTKRYLAVVDGTTSKNQGKIENTLGKIGTYSGQTIYGIVPESQGQRAITEWKCLQRTPRASLLLCAPITGRTHQLRVHLSHIGHPILGDRQYGKHFSCPFHPKRNLLHAYTLSFLHPTTHLSITITAPIPRDFKEALHQLGILPPLRN